MPKREKKFGINPFIIVFKKSVRSAKSRVSIPQKKGGSCSLVQVLRGNKESLERVGLLAPNVRFIGCSIHDP